MRSFLRFPHIALILAMAAISPSHAMISFGYVSKEKAKELGMEVRCLPVGKDTVRVELSFKTDGQFEAFSKESRLNHVDLQINEGKNKQTLNVQLKEDRSQAGRINVGFSISRADLHKVELWVVQYLRGTGDVVRLKDFIDLDKIDAPKVPKVNDGESKPGGIEPPASE